MTVPSAVATALLVGSLVVAAPAAAATPASTAPPALACGDRVEGTVVLDRDLVCTGSPGLLLTRGSTLDLGGHTLRGPGTGEAVLVDWAGTEPGTGPVAVVNGTVRDWGTGLEIREAEVAVRGMTFDHITNGAVSSFNSDVTVDRTTVRRSGGGVSGFFYGSVDVSRSRFVDNRSGVSGSHYVPVTVVGSTFERSGGAVSCGESYAQVRRSRFVGNTTAVDLDWCGGSQVHENDMVGNGTAVRTSSPFPHTDTESEGDQIFRNRFHRNDVALDLTLNAHLQDNLFTHNGTAFRALTQGDLAPVGRIAMERNVFHRNGDAVDVDTPVRMQHTVATHNSGWGIHAPQAVDLGGNVAWGNGREPQCTGVVCAGRPGS